MVTYRVTYMVGDMYGNIATHVGGELKTMDHVIYNV